MKQVDTYFITGCATALVFLFNNTEIKPHATQEVALWTWNEPTTTVYTLMMGVIIDRQYCCQSQYTAQWVS